MTYEVHGPGPGETVGLRSVINFNSHPASQQQPIKLLSFDFSFRLARPEEFNGNRQKSVDPHSLPFQKRARSRKCTHPGDIVNRVVKSLAVSMAAGEGPSDLERLLKVRVHCV